MRTKKGFTLVELVIVIVIIGVLTAVLVPAWMNYIRKARIKTQNNQARAVFTSAQTLVQEYRFMERKQKDEDKEIGSQDFYFYWDGGVGTATVCDIGDDPADGETQSNTTFCKQFGNKLDRLSGTDGSVVFRVYVENYIVKSVVSGRYDDDRYLGSYPQKNDELVDQSVASNHVSNYDMKSIC